MLRYLLFGTILCLFSFFSYGGGGGCTPATNISCGSAVNLSVGSSCTNGTTCGGGPIEPISCPTGSTEGVWYSFTASSTDMNVLVDLITSDGCTNATSVYSGSCGSLTEIGCQSGAPLDDAIPLSGLTIGDTYYVQVAYGPGGPCGNGGSADFCISVEELNCEGGGNNDCSTADPFCTGINYTYCNTSGVASSGAYDCLGSTPNPMWMYLQILDPGDIDILIEQFDYFGGTLDVDFAMYGPFASVSAGCSAISPSSTTVDCSFSTAAVEEANITGAQAGEFYILLITNFSDDPGYITFSQSGGAGTTDCSIIAPCSISGVGNNTSCFSGIDGSIDATWSGTSTYTVQVENSSGTLVGLLNNTSLNSDTFSGLISDTYTLTLTTSDGCTNSVDVVVSEPTALSASNLITNSTCANPNSGVIEIFASGGTEPYNVSWTGESSGDPAGDEITISGGSYNITSLSAGTYTVTVTDANGCTSVQNILFTELDCPIPVVTLPASLPPSLDCASADSYATTDLATYKNG